MHRKLKNWLNLSNRFTWLRRQEVLPGLPDNKMFPPSRSPVWDGSQERAFIESVLNQRFNFLLVFVSLILAGAINAHAWPIVQTIVLTFGTIISGGISITIQRAHHKLGLIMEILKRDKTHPFTIIDNAAGGRTVRWIIGWFIPLLCFFTLDGAAAWGWWTIFSK